MMRKNNSQNRNNNMKHRNNNNGGRRYQNNNRSSGGGHNDGQNITRQKHHATQMREKFANMARDAQNNGDRVDVEYFLQHVEHYSRVLTEIAAIEAERFSHQREQHAAHEPVAAESTQTAQSEGGDEGATDAAGGEQPQQPPVSHQPRPQRQHRRPQQQAQAQPQPASDNGAAEANSNTSEIPLPGSVMPEL